MHRPASRPGADCEIKRASLELTKFNIPVLYYSQLMTLAYGGSAKEAG